MVMWIKINNYSLQLILISIFHLNMTLITVCHSNFYFGITQAILLSHFVLFLVF